MTLDELDALAKGATPGPWRDLEPRGKTQFVDVRSDPDGHVATLWGINNGPTAAYIAALSPATVLALIAVIRAADAMRVGRPIVGRSVKSDAYDAARRALEGGGEKP